MHSIDPAVDTGTALKKDGEEAEEERLPALTVIIPTRNEQENITALLEKLAPALVPLRGEVLFVDDSDDDTTAVIECAAVLSPVPVRWIHRSPAERSGGLASAVLVGAAAACSEWVLVMDADLQHPPEAAVRLAATALRHDVDIVIGTRYAGTGSTGEGLAAPGRSLVSSWSNRLVKAAFPRRLATVTDPMSGLFAFRRSAIDLRGMQPRGFKVLLELLLRNPSARVAELAYVFEPRHAGQTKASLRQGATFLLQVARLRRQRLVGQLRGKTPTGRERLQQAWRMLAFGLVGATGILVNTGALWCLAHLLGLHNLLAAAFATQASTLWNWVLVEALVYRGRGSGSAAGRGARFLLMNNALMLLRLPFIALLMRADLGVYSANALTLVALFALRFVLSDRVIYAATGPENGRDPVQLLVDPAAEATPSAERPQPQTRKRSHYLAYRYDVAGTVTIGSQIRLPELEFFRAGWVDDEDVDIAVRVGDVGPRRPRRRAALTENGSSDKVLRYEEHLGRFGANFSVELGSSIEIVVGPLLARSPHVVYTNIVEALLRYVLVSRGRMLLHSACIELDGTGVMLSAYTDTGKTATVLRLLREHGGRFLSDDMTVVDAEGNAVCFPKPLTISAHTLRAVQADDLTRKEWRRLQFQSRLHSKGGRSIALRLARFNLPIMGINALTQMLVPPPKYSVDRLVPCRLGSSTRVEELFIIQRGAPSLADLGFDETVAQMLANTEDAYGFPPYRYLAPALSIAGLDHAELKRREREILEGFLSGVRTRVLASDRFGWADEIPRLVRGEHPAPEAGVTSRQPVVGWPSWRREQPAAAV